MNTEITDKEEIEGWVLFDGECRLCTASARRFGPLLRRHRFAAAPLQTSWVRERLALTDAELLSEMRLLTRDGEVYGGADALVAMAQRIWWSRPVYWLARIPLVRAWLRKAYWQLAVRRNCFGRACVIAVRSEWTPRLWLKWTPAVALPVAAALLGESLPGWMWMWVLALALFLGAKRLTLFSLPLPRGRVNRLRWLAYWLLWPGMDAAAFFGKGTVPTPSVGDWFGAGLKTLFGAALVWVGAPLIGANHPLVTGWVGMVGAVFLLHFGLFHALSLFWRALGVNAQPIMRRPGAATSLGAFWGQNWNAAFADLMRVHFFKPLARRFGARAAVFAAFIASGALHELVISVPARSGYGLPTTYFIAQGIGHLFEHSKIGRSMGLGSGWKGWCFVALVAGAPAFWLFHLGFIHNVILPMLHAIGAA